MNGECICVAKMMWALLASKMYRSLIVPVSLFVTLGYFQGGLQELFLGLNMNTQKDHLRSAHSVAEASALS